MLLILSLENFWMYNPNYVCPVQVWLLLFLRVPCGRPGAGAAQDQEGGGGQLPLYRQQRPPPHRQQEGPDWRQMWAENNFTSRPGHTIELILIKRWN